MTTGPRLRFLSHLRVGLAATLSGAPTAPNAEAAYGVDVAGVALAGRYRLHGPGDVLGLDAGEVRRSFPRDGANDHEPNLFAHVELASADLPWRFTPGGAVGGVLRPWLVLVVVEDRAAATLVTRSGGALPVLTAPVAELPPLAESWAWAHVQVAFDAAPPDDLAALHAREPGRFTARLVCPRKLEPKRRYLACVVPAFDAGRDAGLGVAPAARTTLGDAWTAAAAQVSLPVYHAWRFACGARGDFESLADRLRPRVAPADLGVAALDLRAPGLGLPAVATPLALVGALCAPGALAAREPTPAETALRAALGRVVDAGAALPLAAQEADPVLAPPCWGAAQAGVQPAAPWQRRLNRDPGWRAVAGLGAELVRSRQEAFAASAWQQLEPARQLQRSLDRDATKEAANRRRRDRLARLAAGDGGDFLVFGRALISTVPFGDRPFAQHLRDDTDLPPQVAAAATARLAVRAGRARRRRGLPAPSAAGMTARFIVPATRPDFAPRPGPGARTLGSRMQPVDTSTLKTLALPSQAGDAQRQAPHAAQRAVAAPLPPPRGAPGIGKALWDAADPARFQRDQRRAAVRADVGFGLGDAGPLPSRLAPPLRFTTPLGTLLARSRPEFLLPGHGRLPNDSVVALAVNPAFVEAFLAGANDAWASELVWREMPASPRATSLRRFWDCDDPGDQIEPIRAWAEAGDLGSHVTPLAGAGGLALLIRGRLLERYPESLLYAVRAVWAGGARAPVAAPAAADVRWPDVTGVLAPGAHYAIFFGLSVAHARGADLAAVDPRDPGGADPGWFFVLEEQAAAPRFGLDVAPAAGAAAAPAHWNELHWGQVTTVPADGTARHLSLAPPRGVKVAGGVAWAAGAAEMASITLQTPYRVYLHASSMLEPAGKP